MPIESEKLEQAVESINPEFSVLEIEIDSNGLCREAEVSTGPLENSNLDNADVLLQNIAEKFKSKNWKIDYEAINVRGLDNPLWENVLTLNVWGIKEAELLNGVKALNKAFDEANLSLEKLREINRAQKQRIIEQVQKQLQL